MKITPILTSIAFVMLHIQPAQAQTWEANASNIFLNPSSAKVGIGTNDPQTKVQIDGANGENPFRVRIGGSTKLMIRSNGGTSIGNYSTIPPSNGLYVHGELRINNSFKARVGVNKNIVFQNWEIGGAGSMAINAHNDANNAHIPLSFAASKFYFHSGSIGIGVRDPTSLLDVNGNITLSTGGSQPVATLSYSENDNLTSLTALTGNLTLGNANGGLIIDENGKVGVGSVDADADFYVDGVFKSTEISSSSLYLPGTATSPQIDFKIQHNEGVGHSIDFSQIVTSTGGIGNTSLLSISSSNAKFSTDLKAKNIEATGLTIATSSHNLLHTNSLGQVAIGTTNFSGDANAKLIVNGKIHANEVEITTMDWADFVFDPQYQLMSTEDLEAYILANKHLPDVPAEQDVIDNGINVGEMNKILLQKIEELTLYMLQQQKQIEEQQQAIDNLTNQQ